LYSGTFERDVAVNDRFMYDFCRDMFRRRNAIKGIKLGRLVFEKALFPIVDFIWEPFLAR
jgi:hypothetical protein